MVSADKKQTSSLGRKNFSKKV